MEVSITADAKPPKADRLANVRRGKLTQGVRTLLYSVDKFGKTTFGAEAPGPIFIGSEQGSAEVDVARMPQPNGWIDIVESIDDLINGTHDFESVVLDTLDWAEPLLWRYICEKNRWQNIESPGYGKGYAVAVDMWRDLTIQLDKLREKRNMNVILLAHSHVKMFRNPTGEDYDRYTLKMHPNSAGVLKEWVDALLFGQQEYLAAQKEGGDSRGKKSFWGVGDGARIVYTERRPAFDAGNRYGLPDRLPLGWKHFAEAVAECRKKSSETAAEATAISEALTALIASMPETDRERANGYAKAAVGDVSKLKKTVEWVKSKITIAEGA